MKHISTLILAILLITACQPSESEPQTVDEMRKVLKSLKSEQSAIDDKIKSLEDKIEEIEPSKEKVKKLVTSLQVAKEDFNRYIDIQGAVSSSDAVMASAEMGGRIVVMDIEEGDFVKQGRLVAKLDVEAINNQIQEINKSLELATDVFTRQERLWNQEIGSEIQFLQAKNNKERLEKTLESVKFQLTKANVYAPISGYADMIFLKKGELAGPGAPIIQIINTNTVKVIADVPESLLGKVKRGQYVTIDFPALEETKKGRVSLIGRSIDPANRTFKVEVDLPNSGGKLKPNLLSIMKINDLTVKDAVAIPLELVQQEISGRDYVFVVSQSDEGSISKKRYVETGPTFESKIVIADGLEEGDQIIMDGARGLSDEELIQVQ